jgi:hypothetical protein
VTVNAAGTDTVPPGSITNLSASAASTSVTLSWRAPGDDGDVFGSASSYDVRYSVTDPATDPSPDKGTWWSTALGAANEPAPSPAGSTQSFTITGLAAGQNYFVAIRSTDDAGNSSAMSNIVSVLTLSTPLPPGNLTASGVSRSLVRLSWTDRSANEAGFVIERGMGTRTFAPLVTLGANVASFDDTSVVPGKTFSYRVKAVNAIGDSAYSNTATVTVPKK